MEKRHFVAIAKVLAVYSRPELPDCKEHELVTDLARDLADVFASQNAAFDRARFLRACGVA